MPPTPILPPPAAPPPTAPTPAAPPDPTADRAAVRVRSEAYLDDLFGDGAGARHAAFVDRLAHPVLRDTLHRYHVLEADETHLSIDDNYLIGMAVLCAQRSFGPAAMFAKTLRHRGVPAARILEVCARLAMWVGGLAAAEAAAHIQKALRDYDQLGLEALAAWFPAPPGAPR